MNSWWYYGAVLLAALALFVMMLRLHAGSWRRLWCLMIYGEHTWQWLYNEPVAVLNPVGHPVWGQRLIGRYSCTRCLEKSEGAARHEQFSRIADSRLHSLAVMRDRFDRESV